MTMLTPIQWFPLCVTECVKAFYSWVLHERYMDGIVMKCMRKNTFSEIKWKQKIVSKSNWIGFLLSIWGTNESKNHPSRMSRILVTQVSREILKNNPKKLLNIINYPNENAYDFSSPISTDWCNKIHSHNFLWFLK